MTVQHGLDVRGAKSIQRCILSPERELGWLVESSSLTTSDDDDGVFQGGLLPIFTSGTK